MGGPSASFASFVAAAISTTVACAASHLASASAASAPHEKAANCEMVGTPPTTLVALNVSATAATGAVRRQMYLLPMLEPPVHSGTEEPSASVAVMVKARTSCPLLWSSRSCTRSRLTGCAPRASDMVYEPLPEASGVE